MSSDSVILCINNGERYLQKPLDCNASQTRLPDEVVGDVGSSAFSS